MYTKDRRNLYSIPLTLACIRIVLFISCLRARRERADFALRNGIRSVKIGRGTSEIEEDSL